jgi:hypothetical protein
MCRAPGDTLLAIVNLRGALLLELAAQPIAAPPPGHAWSLLLDSEERRYGGPRNTEATANDRIYSAVDLDGARVIVLSAERAK